MCAILLSLKLLTIIALIVSIDCIPLPPTIIKQPPLEQLFQVKQSSEESERPFILECEANGYPQPVYRWFKNGIEFNFMEYGNRIIMLLNRGSLVFTKPEKADEGLYQCFAENILGTAVSNAVILRRYELNSFPVENVNEIIVKEGDPLTLECNPPISYPKPDIFWVKITNNRDLYIINNSRLTVDPEGKLHFSNVTLMDQLNDAMYACVAYSVFRTDYKVGRRTNLTVEPSGTSVLNNHSPLVHYVSPSIVTALRAQRFELHCIFGGTPLPDIVWSKRNGSLDDSRYSYTNYGKTLIINKIEYNDEGTYECTVSNGIGSQKSHAMEVSVQSAPFWLKSPNNTIKAEGESVKFECQSSATPEPKLQWFVNGIPLEKTTNNSRRKIEGNVMNIENLISTVDTAVYQCNASNIHGYAFSNFYLNVLKLQATITELQ